MNIVLHRCRECKKYFKVEERGKNWDRVEQMALFISLCDSCEEVKDFVPCNVREPSGYEQ
jgi:hypothetical protein